ncbi:hypothetical protein [Geomicrobium sp. JCM 19038]|uniref:hypothetical protein n=1 Tax=Geomicrobium sp. JCM 19038 TaxID=1460635 RepID=UPI0005AB02A2|nr:hypothetical protein [Geomicrobium sp. JCM 19038]
MNGTLILYLIAGLVLISQFLLSRTKQALWGAILPVLYLILFIIGWTNNIYEVNIRTFIIVGVGGVTILLGIWGSNRHSINKKVKTIE